MWSWVSNWSLVPGTSRITVRCSVVGVGVCFHEPVLDPNQPARAHNILQRGLHVVKVARDQSELLHVGDAGHVVVVHVHSVLALEM